MKNAKKFASLLLALVMVFAMATVAFAVDDNTITVNGAQNGETYNLYKLLDLSVNEDQTAYTYTVNSDWTGFFDGGAGAAYVNIDTQGYVTWKDGMDTAEKMEEFGKAAAKFAADNSVAEVSSKTPAEDGNATFESLASGYYLVTSTNGTLAMVLTTPHDPNAVINEKNRDTTLTKQVEEDSTGAMGAANDAQIGQVVNFQVTIEAKKGAKNYVMHDKMDDGLSFNADSVVIAGLTKDTDYTVVTEGIADGCTFEIRFAPSYLDTLTTDTTLTVTYSAVLDEDADLTAGEKNDAKITWGDNSSTEWSETVTTTHQFSVLKYDAKDDTKAPLADATFQLKDADGNIVKLIKISNTEYRVANGSETGAQDTFVTVADGPIVIKGVDSDSYSLVETQAPAGYNELPEAKTFTVSADNTLVVDVPNQSGTELPTTGGIGTTIFYVLGAILVLGAVVLLITKKRMSTSK